jgi:hypothetical protein
MQLIEDRGEPWRTVASQFKLHEQEQLQRLRADRHGSLFS